jgi:hypothetical protein
MGAEGGLPGVRTVPVFPLAQSKKPVTQNNNQPGQGKVVAVIDDFNTRLFDLDQDGTPDLTHGEVILRQLKSHLPGTTFLKLDIGNVAGRDLYKRLEDGSIDSPQERNRLLHENMETIFEQLNRRLDEGERLDAVNLSLGSVYDIEMMTLQTVSEVTQVPLSKENAPQKLGEVRQQLFNLAKHPHQEERQAYYASYVPLLKGIEGLTKRGVPVYVPSGNQPDEVNPFGLARGAIQVGARDKEGELLPFSANHGMVQRFARGTFSARPVEGGYDLTGNGQAEVSFAEVSGKGSDGNSQQSPLEISGTSFAVPTALAEDLQRK